MNGERGPRIKNNIRCFLPAPYTKVSIAAGKSSHLSTRFKDTLSDWVGWPAVLEVSNMLTKPFSHYADMKAS